MSTSDSKIAQKRKKEKGKALHDLFLWYFKPLPICVTLIMLFVLFCIVMFLACYDKNLSKIEIMHNGVLISWNFCCTHFALICTNLVSNVVQWQATKKIQQSSAEE